MFEITYKPLADRMRYFPAMSRLQTTRSFTDSMYLLAKLSALDAHVVLVQKDALLVGMSVLIPAHRFSHSAMLARKAGFSPEETMVYSMLYVRESERGQNLSGRIVIEMATGAGAYGKKELVTYGFETQDIRAWVRRRDDHEEMACKDGQGDHLYRVKWSRD